MREHNIRLHRIEKEITDSWTVNCLKNLGILTVGDLLSCDFKELIFVPGILHGWKDITALIVRVRCADGAPEKE